MEYTLTCPDDVVSLLQSEGHDISSELVVMLSGTLPTKTEILANVSPVVTAVHALDMKAGALGMHAALNGLAKSGKWIMFVHTHNTEPNEGPVPCRHDIEMTVGLAEICVMLALPLLDHIIIGSDGRTFSLSQSEILPLCIKQALVNLPRGAAGAMLEMLTLGPRESEAPPEAPHRKALPSPMLDAINKRRAQEGKPPIPPA